MKPGTEVYECTNNITLMLLSVQCQVFEQESRSCIQDLLFDTCDMVKYRIFDIPYT